MLPLRKAQGEMMSSKRWMYFAATVATAAALTATGCTEPKGERAGCSTDDQCRAGRVCGPDGQCVDPSQLADAGSPDADSPDTSTPDAGQDDTGTPPDTSGGDTGGGNNGNCPTAVARIGVGDQMEDSRIEAPSMSVIELDGRSSSAAQGDISRYEWSVVDYPYASSLPHLKPRLQTRSDGTATFEANNIGTYVLELSVEDDQGHTSCQAARVTAEITTEAEIYVEMVWDTPGDQDQRDTEGTDMDLHYMLPQGDWGYGPEDIFWDNATADWGAPNDDSDNPVLLRIDDDGAGPESVEHLQAEPRHYRVGAYYYEAGEYGESKVTLRVYLDGALADEIDAEPMPGSDTFYEALTINASNKTTQLDDVHYDGYPPIN